VGVEFDIRASLAAATKAFDQSVASGWRAIKQEGKNLFTRGKEISDPWGAYFKTPLEIRLDSQTGKRKIFWQGYDRSVSASMRRHAAWLRLNGATKEEIGKARAELSAWQGLETVILGLEEGEAVQFLALRSLDSNDGVALQQVSLRNGRLALESQLLPFDRPEQIDKFIESVEFMGESLEINQAETDVDLLVFWAVKGEAIDFKQDVPKLIGAATRAEQLPTIQSRQAVVGDVPEVLAANPLEDRVVSAKPTSFWFEMAAGVKIASRSDPEAAEAAESETIVLDRPEVTPVVFAATSGKIQEREVMEGVRPVVAVKPVSAVSPASRPAKASGKTGGRVDVEAEAGVMPTGSDPVGQQPPSRINPEGIESTRPVEPDQPKVNLDAPQQDFVRDFVDLSAPKHSMEVSEKVDVVKEQDHTEASGKTEVGQLRPSRINPEVVKVEPPVWQVELEGLSWQEIPEWKFDNLLVEGDWGFSVAAGLTSLNEQIMTAKRAFEGRQWPIFDFYCQVSNVVAATLFLIANTFCLDTQGLILAEEKVFEKSGGVVSGLTPNFLRKNES